MFTIYSQSSLHSKRLFVHVPPYIVHTSEKKVPSQIHLMQQLSILIANQN